MKLPQPKEEPFVKQIMEGLNLCGIPCYRIRERLPGSKMSQAGIPDLIGWIPSKKTAYMIPDKTTVNVIWLRAVPLFIEVKRPGKHRRSIEQIEFINRAKRDGCIAMFASSIDDVRRELNEHGIELQYE